MAAVTVCSDLGAQENSLSLFPLHIAMTIWAFVSKVMSLFFNTLSRFVIAFLPRGKHLLISWPQSPSAVIWEPKKIVCHCFPFICREVIGLDA